MSFNKTIDRTERLFHVAFKYYRIWLPSRPVWFRFSTFCISKGVLLFASPWWVPWLASYFGETISNFGIIRAETPLWISPEFYGSIMIVSGLLLGASFLVLTDQSLKLGDYVGTSVRKDDTFVTFARRISEFRKKALKFEDVEESDISVAIPSGPVGGIDVAQLLRQLAMDSQQSALESLYIVESKRVITIGKE